MTNVTGVVEGIERDNTLMGHHLARVTLVHET